MPNWTKEQLDAINKDNSNIIVSAGAGSGKTAVLTERVIRKLKSGVDINHLLVLTFTNAAASEMKDRIRKAIKKEELYEQLDYIDSAFITTFDSYAQTLVRKYHYLLNISSNFNIVESSILDITKKNIIDSIFEEEYENEDFRTLISDFQEKNDNTLKYSILTLNSKLDLKPDKIEYLNNYMEFYNDTNLNDLIDEYEKLIINKKESLKDIIYNISIYADSKFYDKLMEVINPLLESNDYENIKSNLKFTMPRVTNTNDELSTYKKELKENIDKLINLTYYKKEELKENLLSTKKNINVIIRLIKKLDEKIYEYKKHNDLYEFNDIAKLAIEIVKNNKEVNDEIKYYFNEIMVDEYQDTSDMQEAFINLIENQNVYMVGDIKQSIYRFRHANPSIFRNKYNNYSNNIGGIKIDLLKNFRSREEVLKNINEIFDSIMDELIGNASYRKTHRMVYGNTMYELKANQNYDIDIYNYKKEDNYKKYPNEVIEAFIIGRDIQNKISNKYQILDKETKELRDFRYDDACIILDRGTAFDTYKKIFEYLGIPLVVWQDELLSESTSISIIKNIISLIVKIKNKEFDTEFRYYFTSIARSYLFEYDDNTILDIFLNNNFYNTEIYKIAHDISINLDTMDNNMILDSIIDKFNIYYNAIKVGDMKKTIVRLDNLSNLFKSLKDLGYTPYDLPNYFKELNSDSKFSLNTKVPLNVNLMNIHKSKGLEFSVCYFAGFNSKFNDSDIKDNFIFDSLYGFIIPFYKEGIGNTILKDLFKEKYIQEDISERIRLFYVALTRAKEKMIMVTSLEEDNNLYDIVPNNIRMKYRSFKDIMASIYKKMDKYIKNIDLDNYNITLDYDIIKSNNYSSNIDMNNDKIEIKELNIDKNIIEESRFSKVTHKLNDIEEINNMQLGTYIHYLFEITDFKNPNIDSKYKEYILEFIKQIDLNCNIYKEYEFIYTEDNIIKHGIIDLMLEYKDYIDIIDYKLKNTIDENYKKQVSGYKKYIETLTNKKVNTYLYSILDKKKVEIK